MINKWQYEQRLNLPLEVKIIKTQLKIIQWYEHFEGNVYISFSGGKDSTVLLHLVRSIYKDVEAVFCDTGLEYPEVREHVKSIDNVMWLSPKMNFKEVINKWGYPIISKEISRKIHQFKTQNLSDKYRNCLLNGSEKGTMGMIPKKWQFLLNKDIKISSQCCDEMKKKPFKRYEKKTKKKPISGIMAIESRLRKTNYLNNGCNNFNANKQISNPLSFWTEQDILNYIVKYNLKIPSIYGKIYKENDKLHLTGVQRTGCIFCCYGIHLEKYPNRFQKLEKTHNKLWNYCLNNLGFKAVLETINVDYKLKKVSKGKYKIETQLITIRIDKNKFNFLKDININLKNSEIIDNLIDNAYKNIKKQKKPVIINKNKYKIDTLRISIRINKQKFDFIKNYLEIYNNTQIIDYLIDKKCEKCMTLLKK
jgi:3'-phosphoadenosine 5'-phosphosulfate sulfotransferase (PAPS reductase)/FAD synthetase